MQIAVLSLSCSEIGKELSSQRLLYPVASLDSWPSVMESSSACSSSGSTQSQYWGYSSACSRHTDPSGAAWRRCGTLVLPSVAVIVVWGFTALTACPLGMRGDDGIVGTRFRISTAVEWGRPWIGRESMRAIRLARAVICILSRLQAFIRLKIWR